MADEDAFMRQLLNGLGGSAPPPASTTARTWSTTSSRTQPAANQVASTSRLPARPAPSSVRSAGATIRPPIPAPAKAAPPRDVTPGSDYGMGDDDDWAALADNYDAMVEQTKPLPTPALNREPLTRCVVKTIAERFTSNKRLQKVVVLRKNEIMLTRTQVVTATEEETSESLEVVLADDWAYCTQLQPGDVIHVIGELTTSTPRSITLTTSSGLLVQHPDILLTATHVSNSGTCTRKPLLSQMLPGAGADASPALTWGNMLHEVVQACFVARRFDKTFIDLQIEQAINSSLDDLARLKVTAGAARAELNKRAEGLRVFSERYMVDTPQKSGAVVDVGQTGSDKSLVAITGVNAIEEDIWSLRYGLKGKVDATLQISVLEGGKTTEWTQPFEIKTGRSIAGLEHRAQTMLYALMMADRYGLEIPSGLLYYTQGSDLIRVPAKRHEVRAILLLRNEMASHIAARWRDGFDPAKATKRFLPAPIDDEYACKKCFSSDACTLYRKAVEQNPVENPNSPVYDMWKEKTGHLTDAHSEFFAKWERLIALEEADMTRFRRELWTMNARERELRGRAFADLVLAPGPDSDATRHYTFTRKTVPGAAGSLLNGHISQGDAVTISIEPDVLAFSRGFVTELHPDKVVIRVDQPLPLKSKLLVGRGLKRSELVFRIDKDELAGGISRIRDNLARLFFVDGDERRRRLVVDLEPPRFADGVLEGKDRRYKSPVTLNPHQEAALRKAMSALDYTLILGMPGTGKTTVTAELIRRLVRQGKTVLLTSYTHSAVDTILRAVGEVEFDMLRLGKLDKIHADVRKYAIEGQEAAKTIDQYEKRILLPPVVATTCLTIDHAVFFRRKFDVCIVDEASQITLPTCLGPLRYAEKFILIGDHYQLAPLVRSHHARKEGFDVSLFSRLCDAHPEAVANLAMQYRMNEEIMTLSNELVYDGKLQCGSEVVAKQALHLPFPAKAACKLPECIADACWLEKAVAPGSKVLFLDTDSLPAPETKAGDLVQNDTEIKLIEQISEALLARGVFEDDIGVISLYRQQLKALQHALASRPGIEVLTADRSQGRDKPCVLVSMVRSNEEQHTGELLKDWRRINVALTRAKHKLIVIGSRRTLGKVDTLAKFFALCDQRGWSLKLPPKAHLLHDPSRPPPSPAPQRPLKRPASDMEGKENANKPSVFKKRVKTASITPDSLLRSRPLLRDVVREAY